MNSKKNVYDKIRSALKNGLIGDSLSMPVHWFYNTQKIFEMFGPNGIQKFEPAPSFHPTSAINLPSNNQGPDGSCIIDDIILKGKKKFWNTTNLHYHHGLLAGENTLNAECARLLTRVMVKNNGTYSKDKFLDEYIQFMTTKDSHNDIYAESYHRIFFSNLFHKKKNKYQCGEGGASTGGLVTVIPVIFGELIKEKNLVDAKKNVKEHLYLTHPNEELGNVCEELVELISNLLFSDKCPKNAINECYKKLYNNDLSKIVKNVKEDKEILGGLYDVTCNIRSSFPSVLYLAYKYSNEDIKKGLVANANLDGDTCHRGYLLGSLLGAIQGNTLQDFYALLKNHSNIEKEIELFAIALEGNKK